MKNQLGKIRSLASRIPRKGRAAMAAGVLALLLIAQFGEGYDDPVVPEEAEELAQSGPSPQAGESLDGGTPGLGTEPRIGIPAERLIGRWISTNPDTPFGIVLLPRVEEGLPAGAFEGHTARRVWRGWVETDASNPVALHLFYLPRAEEMNPAIPAWARERIDGDLEWRLEFEPVGDEFSRRMRIRWYRGEVHWDDGSAQNVSIVGDGTPLEFEVAYEPVLQIAQSAGLSIGLEAASSLGSDRAQPPLGTVIQDQLFFTSVFMPKRVADMVGPRLSVTFRGLASGAEETLELQASTPGLFGAPVRYTHQFAISLGNCNAFLRPRYKPAVLSPSWFLDLEGEGSCLDFPGLSGETVEVTFQGAAYRFQWFESWVQVAIARQRQEIEKHRTIFNAILTSAAPNAAKDAAQTKLRMIQNYDSLMLSEFLTDLHRLAIGEVYLGGDMGPSAFRVPRDFITGLPSPALGLLFYTDADFRRLARSTARLNLDSSSMWAEATRLLAARGDIADIAANGIRNAQNVVWTLNFNGAPWQPRPQEQDVIERNSDEAQIVYSAVRAVSSRLMNSIAQSYFTGTTFGIYDGLVNSAPFVGNALILSTGKDHFNRPVDKTEYWLTAIGFGSELILSGVSAFDTLNTSYARFDQNVRFDYAAYMSAREAPVPVRRLPGNVDPLLFSVSRAPSGIIESIPGRVVPTDVPVSVPALRQPDIAIRFDPPSLEMAPAVVDIPEQISVRLVGEPPAGAVAREARLVREATADYGPSHSLPTPDPDPAFQPLMQPNADGVVAANYTIWRETGVAVGEGPGLNALREYGNDAVRRNEITPQRALGLGGTERYPDALLDRYMMDNRLEVATLNPARNQAVTALEVQLAIDKGWTVQASMDFGAGGKRIIVVEHVVMDGVTPLRVQAFDPKYGVTIEMDALTFNRALDRNIPDGNLKAVRTTDPALMPTPRTAPPPPPPVVVAPVQDRTPSNVPRPGGIFRFTDMAGQVFDLEVGDVLGGGMNAAAFVLPDQPNLPQRVLRTVPRPRFEAVIIDNYGRGALTDGNVNAANVRGVEIYYSANVQGGRLVEIVERAPQPWSGMRVQQNGQMTRGQALAFEVAARELNAAGYAWLDNHKANFSFEQLPGNDRWRVVVFDAGGIVPAVGDDLASRAANARELQGYIHNPQQAVIDRLDGVTRDFASRPAPDQAGLDRRLLLEYDQLRNQLYPSMQDQIDFDQIGVAPDDIIFQPSIGIEQAQIRQLFQLDNQAFAQAFSAHYGRNPKRRDRNRSVVDVSCRRRRKVKASAGYRLAA